MAYCTIEDISIFTGEVYDEDQEAYLNRWLRVFDILIDDLISDYGKDPLSISIERKNLVASMMGAVAANCYQIDPSVTSQSLTSGDTSESESRLASSTAYSRISRIEPIYLQTLGLKKIQITSARTETRW